MCKTCQEIGHKEEEAAARGFPLVRTKLKLALRHKWAEGKCWLHARQAGCIKDKLSNNAGKMKNQQQKKLPFEVKVGVKIMKINMDEVQAQVDAKDSG